MNGYVASHKALLFMSYLEYFANNQLGFPILWGSEFLHQNNKNYPA